MKRRICIALLILSTGPTLADVTFYTDWHCKGHSFTRPAGRLSSLKEVKYTENCWYEEYYGRDWDIEVPKYGPCTYTFNDKIHSVKVTDGETVEIFRHHKYRGDSVLVGGRDGCHNLRYLAGEGSSYIITR